MLNNYQHTGVNMRIEQLRKLCGREEVDYQTLLAYLKNYKHPRNKIKSWLDQRSLIRVKKGLYVFGPDVALRPYSTEILANLIYGPSALSLSSALSYHGIIPERVVVHTSVTPIRNKVFTTPIGKFTYRYLNFHKYVIGITQQQINHDDNFLIATPEKALADQLCLIDKQLKLTNIADIQNYLLQDLRCDEEQLSKLNLSLLNNIKDAYKDPRISLLINFIKRQQ